MELEIKTFRNKQMEKTKEHFDEYLPSDAFSEKFFGFLALTNELSRLNFFGFALRAHHLPGGAPIAVASGWFHSVAWLIFPHPTHSLFFFFFVLGVSVLRILLFIYILFAEIRLFGRYAYDISQGRESSDNKVITLLFLWHTESEMSTVYSRAIIFRHVDLRHVLETSLGFLVMGQLWAFIGPNLSYSSICPELLNVLSFKYGNFL